MPKNRLTKTVESPRGVQNISRNQRMSLLLTEIWKNGSISRSRLGQITGMALPSVTRFVQDLKNAGIIIETEKGESSGGRQPLLIGLNPEAGVVIGLDFSGIELRGAILDSSNVCLQVKRVPFQEMRPDIFERQVIDLCQELFSDPIIQGRRVLGIGISVPGTVDIEKGVIRDSSNLRLQNYPVRRILEDIFNVPVFVEHDTSVAALAEKYYGAGRGFRDLVYITVSAGIGAGIIIGDEVYRGSTGQAGEFGHITIERNGQVCACGKRGCLEAVAAVPAMLASVHNVYLRQQYASLTAMPGPTEVFTLPMLAQAIEAGDSVAQAILSHSADNLALAISMMVTIIDIPLMIVGGEIIQMGDLYIDALRTSLGNYQPEDQKITIVPAVLGESGALLGIGMVILQNVLGNLAFENIRV